MLELRNRTPFAAALLPSLDQDGVDQLSVLVKATYRIEARGPLSIAEQQVPVHVADVRHGESETSSVKYESDSCPSKPGTDVVLVGKAYPPRGRATIADVSLQVAKLRKVVRVFGERAWTRALTWVMSNPLPFEEMPLVYERAFGGWDRSHPDAKHHTCEERNPVGTGFSSEGRAERMEGLRLPNLEDPSQLIDRWKMRPPIAGFGFVGRGWLPRRLLAGTYDAAWSEQRSPLLPGDFDARYYCGAPEGLVAMPHLRGGESVHVQGASRKGVLTFDLPTPDLDVVISIRRDMATVKPILDTVIIEPDDERVVLSYRATVPCPKLLPHVEIVQVRLR